MGRGPRAYYDLWGLRTGYNMAQRDGSLAEADDLPDGRDYTAFPRRSRWRHCVSADNRYPQRSPPPPPPQVNNENTNKCTAMRWRNEWKGTGEQRRNRRSVRSPLHGVHNVIRVVIVRPTTDTLSTRTALSRVSIDRFFSFVFFAVFSAEIARAWPSDCQRDADPSGFAARAPPRRCIGSAVFRNEIEKYGR